MKRAKALCILGRAAAFPLRTMLTLGLATLIFLGMAILRSPLFAQDPATRRGVAGQAGLSAEAGWTLRPSEWTTRPTTVSATVIDSDGLQPATSAYRLSTDGGGTWGGWVGGGQIQYSSPDSATVHMTATVTGLIDSGTLNRVQFRITDATENAELSPAHTVLVDGTAPATPAGLVASPSGWTNVDSFTLNWSNPSDLTGVVRAYYKLGGTPPSSLNDYTGTRDGVNVSSIPGLMLGAPGAKAAYVWLEDAVGNRNHQNYSQVSLYLDQQAPASPANPTVDPAGWTSTNFFVVQWSNPAGQNAPIARVFYKFDTQPTHANDYTGLREGVGISQINGLTAPRVGEVICYLWLGDQAGNADYTTAVSVTLRYAGNVAPRKGAAGGRLPRDHVRGAPGGG